MTALTNQAENLVLSWLLTAATVTRPTALYVALHTADPTEGGAQNELTVASNASYVRKPLTMGTPSAGQSLSTTVVTWTAAGTSPGFVITHASIWDSLTAGTCIMKAALATSRAIVANGVLTFNVGDIIASLD